MGKKAILFILLLLGLAHPAPAALVVSGDTVTDTVTCLEWQRATADPSGDGVADAMNWQDALAYAEGLSLGGHTDWRLPDYNELTSIVDYSRYSPAIDTTAFPDTVSSNYWSSTTYASNTSYAWRVVFDYGYGSSLYKSSSYYVRAVRGGQCGAFGTLALSLSATPEIVTTSGEPLSFSVLL
ncbi:MAG: Lcl C-terminal domain-containing protein [Desulfobulbaceae bacterium]